MNLLFNTDKLNEKQSDLLNLLSNIINLGIFLYILSAVINTKCLNTIQQLLSLTGILVSFYLSIITSNQFKKAIKN